LTIFGGEEQDALVGYAELGRWWIDGTQQLGLRDDELRSRYLKRMAEFIWRVAWVGTDEARPCTNDTLDEWRVVELGLLSKMLGDSASSRLTLLKACMHTQSPFSSPAARKPAMSSRMRV